MIDIIEVTLREKVSLEAVKYIKKQYPEFTLGVGTVLSKDQVDADRCFRSRFSC